MNAFDSSIITFLNQFAQESIFFDKFVELIANNKLFKGGVMVSVMWYMWFRIDNSKNKSIRENILITLLISIVAIAVGKTLALTMPFRYRPIHEPNLDFNLPFGILETSETNNGILLSSMPSDHAVLYYALSIGLFFMSRKIGVIALLYTTFIISLPRIYLGLHYPTDILVGAFVGILIGVLGNLFLKDNKVIKILMNYSRDKPGIFYAMFFLFCYQIADLFTDSFGLVKSIISIF